MQIVDDILHLQITPSIYIYIFFEVELLQLLYGAKHNFFILNSSY